MVVRRRRFVLLPVGSAGDVHPFIGLGVELARRGHDVHVYTSGHFAGMLDRAGLPFTDVYPDTAFRRTLHDPDAWRPGLPSLRFMVRAACEMLPVHYELLRAESAGPDLVVVAGALAFGARVAQDAFGLPTATLHLAPSAFASTERPPRLPGLPLAAWMPRSLRRLGRRAMDAVADREFGALNRFRAEVGLAPVRRIVTEWIHSPDLVVGMFPAWFAAPASDWPPQARLTDFPLYDEAGERELAAPERTFLRDLENGAAPPVVFTFGSAMVQGEALFAAAVEASRRLGEPAVLLTGYRKQLPAALPAGVRHFDYLPLSRLLPHAAGLVHHGGIGTLAQALAAGIPQLVVPIAYDQLDNARRVERLGAGRAIARRRFDGRRAAAAIERLLADARVAERCPALAARVRPGAGIAAACDLLETLRRAGPVLPPCAHGDHRSGEDDGGADP